MDTITLSDDLVSEKKKDIWKELNQTDSMEAKAFLAHIIELISHPAVVFRGRVVKGTRGLQNRLNLIIFLRRLSWPACIVFTVFSFIKSFWILGNNSHNSCE